MAMFKIISVFCFLICCRFCNAQTAPLQKKIIYTKAKAIPTSRYIYNAPSAIENTGKVNYKIYRYKQLKKEDVKGLVLLSNYDADLATPLLNNIAQHLSNADYIVAIVQHHGNQGLNFVTEAQKVEHDYLSVMNKIFTAYGGSISKTVIGGISFSGFALSYSLSQQSSPFKNIAGLALIASGTNPYIQVPVINKVCANDVDSNTFGNIAGDDLQAALNNNNASIAAKSTCQTDAVCNGHNSSDTWADFFITKIKVWLP